MLSCVRWCYVCAQRLFMRKCGYYLPSPMGKGDHVVVDEVYLLTDVRYRKSDFLTQTSSVSLRLPPSPKGKVNTHAFA